MVFKGITNMYVRGVALHKQLYWYFLYVLHLLGLHHYLPFLSTMLKRAVDWMVPDLEKTYGPRTKGPEFKPLEELTAAEFQRLGIEGFKREFLRNNRPVVIRGMGKLPGWRAPNKWSLEFFRKNYPNVDCLVYKDAAKRELQHMPAGELCDRVKANDAVYGRGLNEFFMADKKLLDDLNLEQVIEMRGGWRRNIGGLGGETGFEALLFISGKDTFTQVHCDVGTNFNMQIEGKKDWIIFPPEMMPFLYTQPYGTNLFYRSLTNPAKPELDQYPAYKYCRGFSVTMESGDLLFLPPMWWHGIINNGIAIGCAMDSFINADLCLNTHLFMVLGTLLNPFNLRKLVKEDILL
eukprot:Opistho-1_new@98893